MTAQIIEKNGKPEYAVVPIAEYQQLLEVAEDLDELIAFDSAVREMEAGYDELVPQGIAKRLVSGNERPLKIWREYRGLTQTDLAAQAGLSQAQIAQMESGKREGKVLVLRKLADVLKIDLDDLVPARDEN
jgi:DNA-binding XRE family transcriptional regulator